MPLMQRIVALCLAAVPIILGVYGIKQMRDTIFGYLNAPYPLLWVQFAAGLAAFAVGLSLIGGFIFHRDRKRNKLQSRFSNKENRL